MAPFSRLGGSTFTTALFDFISLHFKDVPRGFRDADLFQFRPLSGERATPFLFQAAADLSGQVLRRRNHLREERDLLVQIAMLERFDDLLHNQMVERRSVHGASRNLVDRPTGADLDHIVMTVSVGVVALAVEPPVLVVAELGRVKTMRRGEFVTARYAEHGASPK